jgi:hypothetical protein
VASGVDIQIKMEGGKELAAALRALGDERAIGRASRSAVRFALKPVVQRIKENVRSQLDTVNVLDRFIYAGQIRASSTRYNKGTGQARASIKGKDERVRSSSGGVENWAKLAHLFERGTDPHTIHQPKRKRTISHPGITPRPIWSDTFDQNERMMMARYRDKMMERIQKEWAKRAKKGR